MLSWRRSLSARIYGYRRVSAGIVGRTLVTGGVFRSNPGRAARVAKTAPAHCNRGTGWNWSFAAEGDVRRGTDVSREGKILALGFRDSPALIRLAMAPEAQDDKELVDQMVIDVTEPERGVLPEGVVSVEARFGGLFQENLLRKGWDTDELWTPLRRDLTEPVEESGVRIELVGAELVSERVALQRASFERSTFSEDRWHAMAGGLPYADAGASLPTTPRTPRWRW